MGVAGERTAQLPLDALFRPKAVVATLLAGEALALILALAPSRSEDDWLVLFGLASLLVQWIAAGSLALIWLLRRPLARLSLHALAWCSLGCLLAVTAVAPALAWTGLAWFGVALPERASFTIRILAIALVVGLIGLLVFQNYWEARRLAVRAKQLELEALHSRIRPHFLFNTLNTGVALLHARPDAAERVLLDLADLFRTALRGPQLIPLSEELDLTRRYLEIESLRLGERLAVEWALPEPLPDVLVPALSIQPLAENAIRHGIEPRPTGGVLHIDAQVDGRHVIAVVRNPLPDAPHGRPGHSVGLDSAQRRVEGLTQGEGRVEAGVEGDQYVARMRLPLPA
ncbi:hypothetical protein MASR1M8_10110 [Thermomonas brevis]